MRRLALSALTTLVSAALVAGPAASADLPDLHVKVIGNYSTVQHVAKVEQEFWNEIVPEMSGGKVSANYNHQDVMGIKDFQVLRLTKLGVTDFGVSDISKMAGDDPTFEGCDLAGLALDIDMARKVCNAWKPAMNRVMEEKFNAKLLALGTNPPQVFWCRDDVAGIGDLKGRKIRVFNKTMADFIQAIGGTTISMAFGEVVPAFAAGRGGLRGHRNHERQFRRLAGGHHPHLPHVSRLEHQLPGREPRPVEFVHAGNAGVLPEGVRVCSRTTCGRPPPSPPRKRTTAIPAVIRAPWERKRT